MPLPRDATLALGYPLDHLGGDLVHSIARFHTELVTTLLRRGAFRRLVLVAEPYAATRGRGRFEDRPTVRRILRDKPRSVALTLTDYPTLAAEGGRPPTVLHAGGWQDLVHPFRLRRFLAHDRFPVTVSHHGLAPHGVFQSFGVDLLFCDSRPHDAIVATSQAAASVIRASMDHFCASLARHHGVAPRFRGRLEVIGLGVDPRRFRPRPRRPLRARLGLPLDAVVILFLGRFSFFSKADLLPLLRVLRLVVDDSPGVDVVLVVAGGPGRPEHEELFRRYAAELGLGERVRRIPAPDPEDDPLLYAAADVFVCPSDVPGENFGLAPIQAMASGVPQVVSDWDGHRDTVVHGETGFRVPTLWGPCEPALSIRASFLPWGDGAPSMVETTAVDVRAFREQLGALVRDGALRRAMGERSRDRARALFSLDHIASRYEALWGDLSAEARASRAAPPPWVDTMRAPLQEVYRAQVTEVLDGSATLRLAEAGARVVAGEEAVPIAGVEPSLVEHPLAFWILGTLVGEHRGRTAGALVRTAARARRKRHDAVWAAVMWLLKYGYLEVDRRR